jgi:ATP-dependent Clp protease ATP-binding subunit ClpB
VDEVIVFKPLRLEEIRKIVDLLLEQLRERLADRQIGLELTDAARTYVANRGYDPVYGARPLKRLLQRELETRIGRKLIAGEIEDGHTILIDVANGELTVEQVKHAGAESAEV